MVWELQICSVFRLAFRIYLLNFAKTRAFDLQQLPDITFLSFFLFGGWVGGKIADLVS